MIVVSLPQRSVAVYVTVFSPTVDVSSKILLGFKTVPLLLVVTLCPLIDIDLRRSVSNLSVIVIPCAKLNSLPLYTSTLSAPFITGASLYIDSNPF